MKVTKQTKSFLIALLACCAFLMWGTEKAAASISDAKAINVNQTYKGVLKDYDQEDFYKFTISAPGNITLAIKQKHNSTWQGEVLNSSGQVFESFLTDDSEMVSGDAARPVGLPAGTYYIKIENYSGTIGVNYEFKVQYTQSNYYEKELNDSLTTANAIELNKFYTGMLKRYDDKDFYKFTLTKPGNIKLMIENQPGVEWYAHLQDTKGNVYDYMYTDDSEMVTGYASAEAGLPAGTYYLKIENYSNGYETPYQMKVQYTATDYYEKEFNNSITAANGLTVNKTYKGSIQHSDDKDFYKVTLSKPGNVTLSIKQKPGTEWYAHIQDTKGNTYAHLYTDDSEMIEGYAVKEVGLPKGTYYVLINNYSSGIDKPYEFQVKYKASNYYEQEFNNNLTTANSIKLNQSYNGNLQSYDDLDFYKFSVPKDGLVNLQIPQKTGLELYARIQSSSGTVYKDIVTNGSEAVKGNAALQVSLKKGTYYLQIKNNYGYIDIPYSFKLYMQTPALASSKVKVTNNKGKNDSIRVSGIQKGDVVKIYNASSKGKLIAQKTSTGTADTLTVNQIGEKAGEIYVTRTSPSMSESKRTGVSFTGEQTNAVKTSQVKITNNKNKKDVITVSKLKKGDVVKVYTASKGGKLLAKSSKVSKTSATVNISQLGKKAGSVYITAQSDGMKESSRVKVSYKAEK
ncbi:pre-peptidase C-terminal domain-containing protein [Bacillus sp. 7894-2]|uniref:pre-peptidase C-terminal domain-containing protein n=1 Tax=Bacillus sp. 7894-2 TaxID=2021695 RepID=UPI000BA793F9|nr:pre-peptidase C-terminal domain-containing protein [Bacillus sp. 7894-2]PAE25777.1 hypothetical protein CHI10_05705 [Bacillus sp. 7894-2]